MGNFESGLDQTPGVWKAPDNWTPLAPVVIGPLMPLLESWDPSGPQIPVTPAAPRHQALRCHTCGGVIDPDPWGFNGPIIGR